jgi:hypothetical protein
VIKNQNIQAQAFVSFCTNVIKSTKSVYTNKVEHLKCKFEVLQVYAQKKSKNPT